MLCTEHGLQYGKAPGMLICGLTTGVSLVLERGADEELSVIF